MMRSILTSLAGAAFLASATNVANAQQLDMQEMMKWGSARIISYDITGVFKGEALIMTGVGGGVTAKAVVEDKVELFLNWDQTQSQLVGAPSIKNFDTKVGPVIPDSTCPPARPSGKYEHFTALSMQNGPGYVELEARQDFSGGSIPVVCGSSWKDVAASSQTVTSAVTFPAATIMAMPPPLPQGMSKSADGRSIIVEGEGWTWTYTPSILSEAEIEGLELER